MYIHRRMSSADTSKAPHGKLPPSEQCKLWALREVLNKEGEDTAQYEWMSQQVQVKGGDSPGREAVRASSRDVQAFETSRRSLENQQASFFVKF